MRHMHVCHGGPHDGHTMHAQFLQGMYLELDGLVIHEGVPHVQTGDQRP